MRACASKGGGNCLFLLCVWVDARRKDDVSYHTEETKQRSHLEMLLPVRIDWSTLRVVDLIDVSLMSAGTLSPTVDRNKSTADTSVPLHHFKKASGNGTDNRWMDALYNANALVVFIFDETLYPDM